MFLKFFYAIILLTSTTFAKDTITFASIPMQNKNTLIKEFIPMLTHLRKKTSINIQMDYYRDYSELLEAFISGKIDLIYLGPLPYVSLKERYPYTKPIVSFKNQNGDSFYTCSLVSFMDENIDFSHPIIDKKVALTQPLSTCGYLSVEGFFQLNKSSLEKNHYMYMGSHDKVALQVLQGKAQIGGLKTSIAKQYYGLGLNILSVSEAMPMFTLIANTKTLSSKTIDKIQNTLLKTPKDIYKQWGEKTKHGMGRSKEEDYANIIKLKESMTIPLNGNAKL